MTHRDDTGFEMTHVLRVLGREGDVRASWDPSKPDEVTQAQATFAFWRAKGYLAYRVVGSGRGEQMTAFDPAATEVLLCPALRGG